jgi:hypothetical protein
MKLVAYSRHSERLDKAVQVRLHDRLAFEVVGSFRNIEHVDVILRRHGHSVVLLRVPFHGMKSLLACRGQDAE